MKWLTLHSQFFALVLFVTAANAGDSARGREIFALAGGCGCHTPDNGPVGAGGRPIKTPFGTFFGTNITPDVETGIGAWSDDEVIAAIRQGAMRGGGVAAPVMPYSQYAGMADADVRDLVAFLRTLAPAHHPNQPSEVSLPLPRLAYRAWRLLFAPSVTPPAQAPSEPVAHGRYLVDHVSICGDCHTPRNRFGALEADQHLIGTADGPEGETAPNLTPDPATGLGKWPEAAIVELLQSGMLPNADNVQGLMAEVIDGIAGAPGYGAAPESELRSIAKYLKTMPPVPHAVRD
ncbi:MAG: c-type cytochrome [Candidatus Binatia bacterium]